MTARPARLLPWLLFAAVVLVHLPCLSNAFQWDDYDLLFRPELQGWSLAHLRWMWTTTLFGHYAPLTWTSWAVDRSLWGLNPAGFHAVNVLLHAVNAVLVFLLGEKIFPLLFPVSPEGDRWTASLAAALFFALHPLRVETVAWATERRGLLSAFFCLLAALRHMDGDRRSAPLLLLLGVLAKETAMVWPAALFTVDVCLLRRSRPVPWLRENALLLAVALAGAAAGVLATGSEHIPLSWEEHGPHARIVQFFHGLVFYAGKTIWPSGLSPLYKLSTNVGSLPAGRWIAAGAGLLVTVAAFLFRRESPAFFTSWVVFAALLLPTAGFLQSGPQDTADRYTYLAALPWAFWFGAAVRGKGRGAMGLLLVLAGLSLRQQSFWRTPETLWRRAVDISPDSDYARYNLGASLADQGRWDEAEESFRRTLVLNPTMGQAMYNLGVIEQRRGRRRAAEDFYRRTLWIDPGDALAHNNLGRLLMEVGRREEARVQLEEALRLMPDSPVIRRNLEALSAGRPPMERKGLPR